MGRTAPTEKSLLQPEGQPPRVSPIERALIVTIALTYFVDSVASASIGSFLPNWVIERDLSQSWMGLFLGFQTLGILAGTLATPSLVKAVGNNVTLVVGVVMCTVCLLIMSVVPPLLRGVPLGWSIITIRTVAGLGEGLMQVSGLAAVIRIVPEKDVAPIQGMIEGTRALGLTVGPFMGGWVFQCCGFTGTYLVPASLFCSCTISVLALARRIPRDGKGRQEVDAYLFLSRPPVLAICVIIVAVFLPLSLCEPTLEPYLTSSPINLSVGHVGTFFGLVSIGQIFGAVLSGPLIKQVGQLPLLIFPPAILAGSLFVVAFAPKSLATVSIGFSGWSLVVWPIVVAASQLLLRVCRTYELDPKDYSEVIAALLMGTISVTLGVGGIGAGYLADAVGVRLAFGIGGMIVLPAPLAVIWGFNPKVMGRELAPFADETTEKELDAKREAALQADVKGQVDEKGRLGADMRDSDPAAAAGCASACIIL